MINWLTILKVEISSTKRIKFASEQKGIKKFMNTVHF